MQTENTANIRRKKGYLKSNSFKLKCYYRGHEGLFVLIDSFLKAIKLKKKWLIKTKDSRQRYFE